ncbi:hypothetical protein VTJ49DRAFT_2539 [Mycothermus thermophilus]|uniref:Uncharacterized protein n=1 Tax=Humicola insolens TaxID=85995 RepID=A0ABR3VAW8_HUMIN
MSTTSHFADVSADYEAILAEISRLAVTEEKRGHEQSKAIADFQRRSKEFALSKNRRREEALQNKTRLEQEFMRDVLRQFQAYYLECKRQEGNYLDDLERHEHESPEDLQRRMQEHQEDRDHRRNEIDLAWKRRKDELNQDRECLRQHYLLGAQRDSSKFIVSGIIAMLERQKEAFEPGPAEVDNALSTSLAALMRLQGALDESEA